MKRKLFTLLFAFMALASFQVFADNPWWIKVDTSGINPASNLPYGDAKVLPSPPKLKWLVKASGTSAKINNPTSSFFKDGVNSRFNVNPVGGDPTMLNIQPTGGTGNGNISLTYGGNTWSQFEVVKFLNPSTTVPPGPPSGYTFGVANRTVQAYNNTTGVSGYLMPAQGSLSGVQMKDTTTNMLMVVMNKNGLLEIKRLNEVFKKDSVEYAEFNNANYVYTEWPNYHEAGATNISRLNAGLTTVGSTVTLGSGSYGGYNRNVAYIAISNPTGDFTNVSTKYTTQYIGNKTGNDVLTDLAGWTNGFPLATYPLGSANDGPSAPNNANGNAVYCIVVQNATGTAAAPQPVFKKFETGLAYTTAAITNSWRPVWIELEKPAGRWATPADFTTCKYYTFPGLYVVKSQKNDPYFTTDTVRTFAVAQVDWIAKGDGNQSKQNIFGNKSINALGERNHGALYNTEFNAANGSVFYGGQDVGLQMGATLSAPAVSTSDNIIPLFTLSSPELSCGVVSVSLRNDLDIQSQGNGVYANKLEIRDYGHFYYYNKAGIYTEAEATSGHQWGWIHSGGTGVGKDSTELYEDRVATSLQKFAFWIDIDGNYSMYPAASYSWKYGDPKESQANTVLPNSVFKYNNPDIIETTGGTYGSDKGWGVKIGTWNGRTKTDPKGDKEIITTIPNVIQEKSDYTPITYIPNCGDKSLDIAGRFFFLDVMNPEVPYLTEDNTTAGSLYRRFFEATRGNAFQDSTKTQYVLSTEVRMVGGVEQKHLIVTPKEKVRGYADANGNKWYNDLAKDYKKIEGGSLLPDYWSNSPYDSVNMAAHWEIIKKGDAYVFVNMLGDTLQYDLALGANSEALVGGYLPISNQMSFEGRLDKLNAATGPYGYKWFDRNPTSWTSTAQSTWTVSVIPGDKNGDLFALTAGGYTLSLKPTGPSGSATDPWYTNGVHAKGILSNSDSLYFQRDVELKAPINGFELWTTKDPHASCAGGLILKKSPIYYVPNHSGSYAGEDETKGDDWKYINTNDKNFVDKAAQVYQDSLTAYLLLHGEYGIKEALRVENDLLLGSETTETGVHAAALTIKKDNEALVKFIPLVTVSAERNAHIRTAASAYSTVQAGMGTDTLYGETYKWFIVQLGKEYLVFDTINPNALDERLKVGFTFQETDIANATPVRLYQPLVGDKLQGNFIFQFYVPNNTYDVKEPARSYENKWPTIDYSGKLNGHLMFGQLSNHSNYIHGVSERAKATRFTYVLKKNVVTCGGCEQFIAPDWMADEKLVGFPIKNQIWVQTGASNFSFGSHKSNDNVDKNVTEAIASDAKLSKVKHVYADSISKKVKGEYTYAYNKNAAGTALTTTISGFKKDLGVALYYVVNEKDEYLTVDTNTYQYNSQVTVPDVTGVNLIWAKKYEYDDKYKDAFKNKQALQLFAITGIDPRAGTDKNGWYTDCGTYVYLPLASYKVDYQNGKVLTDSIFYNLNLGEASSLCNGGNNATKVFRVGQYSPITRNIKNLVVSNASGENLASVIPVEFKWQREAFDQIGCEYQLVKDVTPVTGKPANNFYYASGGRNTANCNLEKLAKADEYTLLAHWHITRPDSNDPELHNFIPEYAREYDDNYGDTITKKNNQLFGNFYFLITETLKKDGAVSGWKVDAYNFKDYYKNYTVEPSKFEITCVEHKLPFYDLENNNEFNYVLPAQLAILETPFADRNLTDVGYNGKDTIHKGEIGESWQVFLTKNAETDFKGAKYLNAYKVFDRYMAEDKGHVIPYYAFSIKDEKSGKEYFLNVHKRHGNNPESTDSVYWTALEQKDIEKLTKQHADYPTAFSLYKFCFPYRFTTDGVMDSTKIDGAKLPQVYMQTLDTAKADVPYLIVAGASTSFVTANRLRNAILPAYRECYDYWNIYTVDYTKIDDKQVTSWIISGEKPADNEWVPLYDKVTDKYGTGNADGLLTNYKLNMGGASFVTESQESPVNYGVLLGRKIDDRTKLPTLHFEYEGTEVIGNTWKRPIYYYRIQIPGENEGWLTDSKDSTKADYTYNWGNPAADYDLAFFGEKVPNGVTGKKYDKNYAQTFGMRFTDSETLKHFETPAETFVVVSHADFESKSPEANYRYLAEVNGHLVFVKGVENALLFQYGKDVNDKYTEIEAVGTGGVIGVQGGIRILNQTGTVNIYSIDGSLIKTVQVTGADQTITVPRGIVVVKIAGNATKVVVK